MAAAVLIHEPRLHLVVALLALVSPFTECDPATSGRNCSIVTDDSDSGHRMLLGWLIDLPLWAQGVVLGSIGLLLAVGCAMTAVVFCRCCQRRRKKRRAKRRNRCRLPTVSELVSDPTTEQTTVDDHIDREANRQRQTSPSPTDAEHRPLPACPPKDNEAEDTDDADSVFILSPQIDTPASRPEHVIGDNKPRSPSRKPPVGLPVNLMAMCPKSPPSLFDELRDRLGGMANRSEQQQQHSAAVDRSPPPTVPKASRPAIRAAVQVCESPSKPAAQTSSKSPKRAVDDKRRAYVNTEPGGSMESEVTNKNDDGDEDDDDDDDGYVKPRQSQSVSSSSNDDGDADADDDYVKPSGRHDNSSTDDDDTMQLVTSTPAVCDKLPHCRAAKSPLHDYVNVQKTLSHFR